MEFLIRRLADIGIDALSVHTAAFQQHGLVGQAQFIQQFNHRRQTTKDLHQHHCVRALERFTQARIIKGPEEIACIRKSAELAKEFNFLAKQLEQLVEQFVKSDARFGAALLDNLDSDDTPANAEQQRDSEAIELF